MTGAFRAEFTPFEGQWTCDVTMGQVRAVARESSMVKALDEALRHIPDGTPAKTHAQAPCNAGSACGLSYPAVMRAGAWADDEATCPACNAVVEAQKLNEAFRAHVGRMVEILGVDCPAAVTFDALFPVIEARAACVMANQAGERQ